MPHGPGQVAVGAATGPHRHARLAFIPDAADLQDRRLRLRRHGAALPRVGLPNKGLWFSFIDERETGTRSFYFEGGILSFVRHLNKDRDVLHNRPIYVERTRRAIAVEVALQYNDAYSETVFSFANNINTIDGGTHLTGFRTALTRCSTTTPRKHDPQGRRRQPDRRRRARGPDGRDQRQAARAAVRGPDQGASWATPRSRARSRRRWPKA